jgi:hypothetical protein
MSAIAGDYQFAAEPRPVRLKTQKYRDTENDEKIVPTNLMYDRRVVRGLTFTTVPLNTNTSEEKASHRSAKISQQQEVDEEPTTPEAPQGCKYSDAQTDDMSEDPFDEVPEYNIYTQTEVVWIKAKPNLSMPVKTGVDKEVEVEDGDLFCFNDEVRPLLTVLVGKSLEQARMEVLEEEELRAMRQHRTDVMEQKHREMLEVQDLEAQEQMRYTEAQRRKKEARARKTGLVFAHRKFCCRIYSKNYLKPLALSALKEVEDAGLFKDVRELQFNDKLVPWLVSNVLRIKTKEQEVERNSWNYVVMGSIELAELHLAAVEGYYHRKEQTRLDGIMRHEENERRKARRREQRLIRQRQRELEALKRRIHETVVASGALLGPTIAQPYADISPYLTTPSVCTPAGIFGELLLSVSVTEEILGSSFTETELKDMMQKFMMTEVRNTEFRFGFLQAAKLTQMMEELDQTGLTLDNLETSNEESKARFLTFLQDRDNVEPSTTLYAIWRDLERYRIREGLIEGLNKALYMVMTGKDVPGPVRHRVKLVVVDPVEEGLERPVALIRLLPRPDEEDEPLTTNRGSQDKLAQSSKPPKDSERSEDKVLAVVTKTDEFSVIVISRRAQTVFRSSFSRYMSGMKSADLMADLKPRINRKAMGFEINLMADIGEGLPVFDYEVSSS